MAYGTTYPKISGLHEEIGDALYQSDEIASALIEYHKAFSTNPSPALKHKMEKAYQLLRELESMYND